MRANGFSLIELLVVISILAIVNFVLFPNIKAIQNSAKILSSKSIARNIMVSLEQYYFVYQEYPDGINVSIDSILTTLDSVDLIQTFPTNPFTGEVYTSNDESGEIIYNYNDSDGYTLIGYGINNDEVIFEY